jgi:hypothetical protein
VDTLYISFFSKSFHQFDKADRFEEFVIFYHNPRDKSHTITFGITRRVGKETNVSCRGTTFFEAQVDNNWQLTNGDGIGNVSEFIRSPENISSQDVGVIYHQPHYGIVMYKYFQGETFELVLD